jgi:hypothetical protein
MKPSELNRDIKRLSAKVKSISNSPNYFDIVESEIKTEFKRLYYADTELKYMNLNSIKIMLRLNVQLRIIPFHNFGLFIEL